MGKINIAKPKILTGTEMMGEADRMARAEIEAKRGIKRDAGGGIILTDKQKAERIEVLKEKKLIIKQRIKNAEAAKDKNKRSILEQRLIDIDARIKELKK